MTTRLILSTLESAHIIVIMESNASWSEISNKYLKRPGYGYEKDNLYFRNTKILFRKYSDIEPVISSIYFCCSSGKDAEIYISTVLSDTIFNTFQRVEVLPVHRSERKILESVEGGKDNQYKLAAHMSVGRINFTFQSIPINAFSLEALGLQPIEEVESAIRKGHVIKKLAL